MDNQLGHLVDAFPGLVWTMPSGGHIVFLKIKSQPGRICTFPNEESGAMFAFSPARAREGAARGDRHGTKPSAAIPLMGYSE